MPTYTIYSGASDGSIQSTNATYATARTGGTLAVQDAASGGLCGQAEFFGYACREAFMDFDTSVITDTDTIDSAALGIYGSNDFSTTDFTIQVRLNDWGGTLTTADWVSGASLSGTLLATYATSGGWSTAGYNTFTDVAFPANINKAGSTRVMFNSDRHAAGSAPAGFTNEFVDAYYADDAGTTRDPKLVVVTTAAVVPRHPFVNHQNPAWMFRALREKWNRRRTGLLVPDHGLARVA
jgi:hypothetical protein